MLIGIFSHYFCTSWVKLLLLGQKQKQKNMVGNFGTCISYDIDLSKDFWKEKPFYTLYIGKLFLARSHLTCHGRDHSKFAIKILNRDKCLPYPTFFSFFFFK